MGLEPNCRTCADVAYRMQSLLQLQFGQIETYVWVTISKLECIYQINTRSLPRAGDESILVSATTDISKVVVMAHVTAAQPTDLRV